jgi:hypothetical protein
MNRWTFVGSVILISILLVVFASGNRASSGLKSPVFKLAAGAPIEVGPMAGDPVIADCNQDGRPDIIVACGTCCGSPPSPLSGHVQVLLGDGRGGFQAAAGSPIPIGPSARKVAAGDANGDGKLDIFVAQHDSYEVVALLGDGRGGFKPAPGSPFLSASGPQVHPRAHTHAITAGDVNADGKLDLLTTNANDNSISILLGDGAGRFAPAPNSPVKAGRHPYDALYLQDVNGDAKPDIITPNLAGNAVMVMLNDGNGGFTKSAGAPFALGPRPGYLAIADLNGDGKLDLAATHDDDSLVELLLGDGKGSFVPTAGSKPVPSHPVWGVVAKDVNGDRFNDLIFGSQLDHGLSVLLGDGKGSFAPTGSGSLPAGKRANYVAVADLNRDGKPDIVGSSYGGGQLTVYLNQTRRPTPLARI